MPALIAVSIAGFAGYSTLIAVAPLWAVRGGAGPGGAGLVNAVLLLTTVAVQFGVPRLLDRFGHTAVLVAGLVFLGLPALGYGLSDRLAPVLAMSALRGVGFAIITVTGSAMVARLVPPGRLGAGIGVYGLAVAVPMLVLLPLSVPIADRLGFEAAFALAALPLLGVPAAFPLGRRMDRLARATRADAARADAARVDPAVRPAAGRSERRELARRLGRPIGILLSVTLAGGGVLTFLPQLVGSSDLAAAGLLALSLTAAASRFAIGALADRTGPKPYLAPLLLLTAASMLGTAGWLRAPGDSWVLVAAVGVVGVGYGALQSLTLVVSFQEASRDQVNRASAAWNAGFDAGTGLGALLTGYLAAGYSFPTAFAVLAVIVLAALAAVPGIGTQAR
jgi:MFS family permease